MQHLFGFRQLVSLKVGIQAQETNAAEHFTLAPWAVGQTVLEAQLTVERPVQVVLEQVVGFIMLVVEYRFREQPVQLGAVTDPAVDEITVAGGGMLDFR